MAKYNQFFNSLNSVVEGLDRNEVKLIIGDSVNNNRALTVNQVIRFFESGEGPRGSKKLAANLSNVYDFLRPTILENRFNCRTDAVDINEFLHFYSEGAISNLSLGRSVSRYLSL